MFIPKYHVWHFLAACSMAWLESLICYQIKLALAFKGGIDFKNTKQLFWNLDNYFQLTSLADKN